MVINSMMIAMEACSKSVSKTLIYHVGSSLRNPFRIADLEDMSHQYFTKHPLIDKYGKPVTMLKKVTWMSMSSFDLYIKIRYMLPLMQYLSSVQTQRPLLRLRSSVVNNSVVKKLRKDFDDKNAENLRMEKKEEDDDVGSFNFDPTSIDWKEYLLNAHIPGLVEYGVK
ncbi:unnamed protein product [Sphenostylis stenocarpa]|uniref:Fatty acyl-CoA reductase C-terminal domain-containing protein n=1 Tax=Sphenostylis stenocarpa TaxID=92480 RepID=A0AA87BB26_9FABA|nr:unnamed protein product [Sphenostylis stenocarpa]